MLGAVKPVDLPINDDEVRLIQARQKALQGQIRTIENKIRSGIYSNSHGHNLIRRLQGEIVELDRYKATRRPTGTVQWTTAPSRTMRQPASRAPAKKYTPETAKPVPVPKNPWTGGGKAQKINTGTPRKPTIRDNKFGKDYSTYFSTSERQQSGGYYWKDGGRYFAPKSTQDIKNWMDWNQMHFQKKYQGRLAPVTTQRATTGTRTTATPVLTVKDNPNGKSYGSSVSFVEKSVNAGGAKPIKYGSSYYGPAIATKRRDWEDWNRKWVGKPRSSYKESVARGTASTTTARATATKTTSTTKNVSQNPYGRSYGTSVSFTEKSIYAGGAKPIKYGSSYYGPKIAAYRLNWESWNKKYLTSRPAETRTASTTDYRASRTSPAKNVSQNPYGRSYGTSVSFTEKMYAAGAKPVKYGSSYYGPKAPNYRKSWESWNNKYLSSSTTSTVDVRDPPPAAPSKKIYENPYGQSYGTSYSTTDRYQSGGVYKKYGSRYYGPKPVKAGLLSVPSPNNVKNWKAWNSKYGLSGIGYGVEQIFHDKQEKRRRQRHRMSANRRINRGEIHRRNVHRARNFHLREETMMRARAGSRLNLDEVGRKKRPSWTQVATPMEKAMIQQGLSMVGMKELPPLSEKGNNLMLKAININRTKNRDQQMAKGSALMSEVLTELVNKSGYLASSKKIQIKTNPMRVEVADMAGIGGGLVKTRNSMQRLLKQ